MLRVTDLALNTDHLHPLRHGRLQRLFNAWWDGRDHAHPGPSINTALSLALNSVIRHSGKTLHDACIAIRDDLECSRDALNSPAPENGLWVYEGGHHLSIKNFACGAAQFNIIVIDLEDEGLVVDSSLGTSMVIERLSLGIPLIGDYGDARRGLEEHDRILSSFGGDEDAMRLASDELAARLAKAGHLSGGRSDGSEH